MPNQPLGSGAEGSFRIACFAMGVCEPGVPGKFRRCETQSWGASEALNKERYEAAKMCDDVGNSCSNNGAGACGSPVSRSTARLVAAQARAKKVKSASSSQKPPLPAPMLAKLATAWTTSHKFGLLVAELTL